MQHALLSSPPEARALISLSSFAAIFDVEVATVPHRLLFVFCTVPLSCLLIIFFFLVRVVVFGGPVLSRVRALSLSTPTPAAHPSCLHSDTAHIPAARFISSFVVGSVLLKTIGSILAPLCHHFELT